MNETERTADSGKDKLLQITPAKAVQIARDNVLERLSLHRGQAEHHQTRLDLQLSLVTTLEDRLGELNDWLATYWDNPLHNAEAIPTSSRTP